MNEEMKKRMLARPCRGEVWVVAIDDDANELFDFYESEDCEVCGKPGRIYEVLDLNDSHEAVLCHECAARIEAENEEAYGEELDARMLEEELTA